MSVGNSKKYPVTSLLISSMIRDFIFDSNNEAHNTKNSAFSGK